MQKAPANSAVLRIPKTLVMNSYVSIYGLTLRLILLSLIWTATNVVLAQSDSAEEGSEKADAIIELRYVEANNASKFLKAIVKSEVDDFYQPVTGLELRFYRTAATPENLIGKATTNAKGQAICDLTTKEASYFAPSPNYIYLVAIEDNTQYNDTEEEITVAESTFEMDFQIEDSVKQVLITLTGMDENGETVPVADAEVGIYIKRLFGLLPVTEDLETTDEDGSILIDFPSDFPGDSLGNLIIVAKINEHERYGFLEVRKKINWGIPVQIQAARKERELWSSRANAPWYLIIFVNAALIGIWGVILYIIYKIFQIKKIGASKIKLSE